MRGRLTLLISAIVVLLLLLVWRFQTKKHATESSMPPAGYAPPSGSSTATPSTSTSSNSAPTNVYAHNLMLRKGPSFRVYVRWLRGQMARTRRGVNPSFDDPESFFLDIK